MGKTIRNWMVKVLRWRKSSLYPQPSKDTEGWSSESWYRVQNLSDLKQPKYSSTEEQIKKMWFIHTHTHTHTHTRICIHTCICIHTFPFHFHALEKEMATHSSVLAWRILGTEEPGGLPSLGSHRVGHDWSDLAYTHVNWTWNNRLVPNRKRSTSRLYIVTLLI